MRMKRIMMVLVLAIPLLVLSGCGGAPSADSQDVKNLVMDICRRPGAIAKFGLNDAKLGLRAVRIISVDKKIGKTTAQAELLLYLSFRPEPLVYQIVYTAQYTSDGELYVTLISAR